MPGAPNDDEYYVELRKLTCVGIKFFQDARGSRLATLMPESLNDLYSNLLWSLTRNEIFFRPIECECGRTVALDARFHGQNSDPEPWA